LYCTFNIGGAGFGNGNNSSCALAHNLPKKIFTSKLLKYLVGQKRHNKSSSIKGTGSPDGLRYFLNVWIDVGINKRRWWFLNF
jgi:hypothetical protein